MFGRVRNECVCIIWKEAVVVYFETQFWYSFGGTREKTFTKKKISQEIQCRLRVSNLQIPYCNSRVLVSIRTAVLWNVGPNSDIEFVSLHHSPIPKSSTCFPHDAPSSWDSVQTLYYQLCNYCNKKEKCQSDIFVSFTFVSV